MTGFVYAVGDGEGRVKIGWSRNPLGRLKKIKTDCACTPSLLGIIDATMAQESELHSLLAHWCTGGEWYRLEGAVVDFVNMLGKPEPRLCRAVERARITQIPGQAPDQVPELIDRLGGPTAFSRIIGKGVSTASEMKRNRSVPVEYWPRVIAAARAQGLDKVTAEFLMKMHVNEDAA